MAEGARLERVWAGNRLVGSNPTPSAKRLCNAHYRRPARSENSQLNQLDRVCLEHLIQSLPVASLGRSTGESQKENQG